MNEIEDTIAIKVIEDSVFILTSTRLLLHRHFSLDSEEPLLKANVVELKTFPKLPVIIASDLVAFEFNDSRNKLLIALKDSFIVLNIGAVTGLNGLCRSDAIISKVTLVGQHVNNQENDANYILKGSFLTDSTDFSSMISVSYNYVSMIHSTGENSYSGKLKVERLGILLVEFMLELNSRNGEKAARGKVMHSKNTDIFHVDVEIEYSEHGLSSLSLPKIFLANHTLAHGERAIVSCKWVPNYLVGTDGYVATLEKHGDLKIFDLTFHREMFHISRAIHYINFKARVYDMDYLTTATASGATNNHFANLASNSTLDLDVDEPEFSTLCFHDGSNAQYDTHEFLIGINVFEHLSVLVLRSDGTILSANPFLPFATLDSKLQRDISFQIVNYNNIEIAFDEDGENMDEQNHMLDFLKNHIHNNEKHLKQWISITMSSICSDKVLNSKEVLQPQIQVINAMDLPPENKMNQRQFQEFDMDTYSSTLTADDITLIRGNDYVESVLILRAWSNAVVDVLVYPEATLPCFQLVDLTVAAEKRTEKMKLEQRLKNFRMRQQSTFAPTSHASIVVKRNPRIKLGASLTAAALDFSSVKSMTTTKQAEKSNNDSSIAACNWVKGLKAHTLDNMAATLSRSSVAPVDSVPTSCSFVINESNNEKRISLDLYDSLRRCWLGCEFETESLFNMMQEEIAPRDIIASQGFILNSAVIPIPKDAKIHSKFLLGMTRKHNKKFVIWSKHSTLLRFAEISAISSYEMVKSIDYKLKQADRQKDDILVQSRENLNIILDNITRSDTDRTTEQFQKLFDDFLTLPTELQVNALVKLTKNEMKAKQLHGAKWMLQLLENLTLGNEHDKISPLMALQKKFAALNLRYLEQQKQFENQVNQVNDIVKTLQNCQTSNQILADRAQKIIELQNLTDMFMDDVNDRHSRLQEGISPEEISFYDKISSSFLPKVNQLAEETLIVKRDVVLILQKTCSANEHKNTDFDESNKDEMTRYLKATDELINKSLELIQPTFI